MYDSVGVVSVPVENVALRSLDGYGCGKAKGSVSTALQLKSLNPFHWRLVYSPLM